MVVHSGCSVVHSVVVVWYIVVVVVLVEMAVQVKEQVVEAILIGSYVSVTGSSLVLFLD